MIYTLTLNPSIDYVIELDQVELGSLNRTVKETKFPGGKGINVSRVLKRLKTDSMALGFIGGFTGRFIEEYLETEQIASDFVRVNEDTRINVKIKTENETEINAKGPKITDLEYETLKKKIMNLSQCDLLVLAGSIPSTLPATTYEELVKICSENSAKFVVDAEGELLKKVLPYRPFLIKPNHHELGELFHTTIAECEEVVPYARKLIEMGAQNVIVSLADKGAVFINTETLLVAEVPRGTVKSSVGAGDSTVAGFLAKYQETKSFEDAFKYGVSSGSATAFSIGLCTREKIEEILPQVVIRKS
ncbi:1-phosphofructokinase [Neobacillus sp. PS3-34]|uniref:1-phosphofructokinase n=1 Tax=Neobacillus sp. PS3-34 TaxID=3070678 RepID=UPI0027E1BCB8|nr:1-phosphofructokinase [Neobacillus sp. PS3-34]WML47897.1 1-phosphofructokinase [Neobacillus sp. PS3-34]